MDAPTAATSVPVLGSAVDILKVGFSGLVFLLSYMSYSLLRKEQAKGTPDPTILSAIYKYTQYTFIAALLVILSGVIQSILLNQGVSAVARENLPNCQQAIERLKGAVSHGATAEGLTSFANTTVDECEIPLDQIHQKIPAE